MRTVHNVDITKSEDSSETISVQADFFHNILLGGDQLTCARVRGSQRIRENSTNGSARLEGVVPVIEDWHARVCYLQVQFVHV